MKHKFLIPVLLAAVAIGLTGCFNNNNGNAGPTINETLSKKNFTSLNVNANDADVKLYASDQAKVIYNGPKKLKPEVKVKDGKLEVTQKAKNGIKIINGTDEIKIYLPKKAISTITVSANDGDIITNGTVVAKYVNLDSDDGDINIDRLNVTRGLASSDDGDIAVNQLRSINGFNLNSSDGDINVKSSNATGFDLTSDDGDVTIDTGKSSTSGKSSDNGDGGSYQEKLSSRNVLRAHSDDGDVVVR